MKGTTPITPRLFALLASAALFSQSSPAQVPFSGGAYSQSFNSLASSGTANGWTDNTTLAGWYAAKAAGGAITTYQASPGTITAGALYSFGAASSGERGLGALESGATGNIAFGVRFANDTAQTISNIIISCTAEEWRSGNTTSQSLTFGYRIGSSITDPDVANANTWTGVSALNFVSPVNTGGGALDGNTAPNRQVYTSVPLTGVTVPTGQEIFFRWYATKASSGSSDGLGIDDLTISFSGPSSVTNPPTISDLGQPVSRTNKAGTVATFSVTPDGTPPFTYRWWKGASPLSDGGNISGATNSTLSVANVLAADAGSFFVGVTNSAGGVISAVATLTVNDPAILAQPPAGRTYFSGDTALLSVTAGGTPTLSYQWYKDDSPLSNDGRISGATASTLSVGNLGSADMGTYQVIVTNSLGAATSTLAVVTVIVVPSGRVAQWNFNDTNAPLASPPPSLGSGTASLLNGVTASYASGSSFDLGATNQAWNTTHYPASTVSNKTAGVQFNASTAGYTNIVVTWEQDNSNTGSKYARLQYSTDGTNFTDFDLITGTSSSSHHSSDLSSLPAVQNNPDFAFRIVTEFESTAVNTANASYVQTSGTSSYGTSGTIRFDLVTVFGEPISGALPIPLHIEHVGSNVVLSWNNPVFGLQSSPVLVSSSFTNVPGATSPYTNAIGAGPQFFRLKH